MNLGGTVDNHDYNYIHNEYPSFYLDVDDNVLLHLGDPILDNLGWHEPNDRW